jgi:hypothetical protein
MKRIFFPFLVFMALLACKPSTSSNTTSEDTQPSVEKPQTTDPSSQISTETVKDTTTGSENETTTVDNRYNDQAPPVKSKPKICDPNFTKLSSPKRNHHIYYVTDFNPGEFKCWISLEEHGAKICDGTSCIVYYVDSPKVKIEPGLTDYMNPETLKSNGIGRYEYNGKYWEFKGASMWKRSGNGFAYYNTDNQLGG